MSDHIADVRKKDNNWGLIDKQELYKECYKVYEEALSYAPSAIANHHAQQMILKIEQKIKQAPTVDAKIVVHARWERVGVGITERVICSNCKSSWGSWKRPPYCNQCGATMDLEERNEIE